jgi:prefoldin beta subunit
MMSNSEEIPPYLREQLARYEQLQQNLQTILLQKQQVDLEATEVEKALEELKKVSDTDAVYKSAGNLLVRAKKDDLIKELDERKELSGTRSAVLAKQEQRVRESVKELEGKIQEALKSRNPSTLNISPSS